MYVITIYSYLTEMRNVKFEPRFVCVEKINYFRISFAIYWMNPSRSKQMMAQMWSACDIYSCSCSLQSHTKMSIGYIRTINASTSVTLCDSQTHIRCATFLSHSSTEHAGQHGENGTEMRKLATGKSRRNTFYMVKTWK